MKGFSDWRGPLLVVRSGVADMTGRDSAGGVRCEKRFAFAPPVDDEKRSRLPRQAPDKHERKVDSRRRLSLCFCPRTQAPPSRSSSTRRASSSRPQRSGKETSFFACAILYSRGSFYQDRLGTNAGEALIKRVPWCCVLAACSSPAACTATRSAWTGETAE